jgi:hypothetical protein
MGVLTPQSLPETHLPSAHRVREGSPYLILLSALGAIFALLIVYSQTRAFVWDEGFHLLAAKFISQGKRPYIDFCFPQTPLNAYLNAVLIHFFGDTWRPAHLVAALFLSAAIFLAVDYVFVRLPEPKWKLPAAVFAAILIVSIYDMAAFGTVAQAYAICTFLTIASFRVASAAIRQASLILIFFAGVLASASAACSMLTAAAVPVILVWCAIQNKPAWIKTTLVFLAGCFVPFVPVLWLFVEGPRQVWFNVIQYQALYRRINWGDATPHDWEVFLGFSETPPGLMLLLFAAAGLYFVARRSEWDRALRSEFYLSGAIAAAIAAELWTAHPTFERYFLLTVPLLAMPAAVGLMFTASKLYGADRPWPTVIGASVLAIYSLANQLYSDRDSVKWGTMQDVAAKVQEVTPSGATVYADELTYFLTGRPVPPGMEFSYGHKLELPADRAAMFHILPQSKLDVMVRNKTFATLESCDDDEIDRLKLDTLYSKKVEIENCHVFWDLK